MELWIRSQDKMDLFKINRLKIREHTFEDGKKEYFILNNNSISDVVGVYKTKERALEVLNEIQNLLQPTIEYKPIVQEEPNTLYPYKNFVKVDGTIEIKELSIFVYQMPEN